MSLICSLLLVAWLIAIAEVYSCDGHIEHSVHADRCCCVQCQVKDGVVGGVDCQRLDKFEDFIREMVKEGRIASMVRNAIVVMCVMCKAHHLTVSIGQDCTVPLHVPVSSCDDAAGEDAGNTCGRGAAQGRAGCRWRCACFFWPVPCLQPVEMQLFII